MKIKIILILLIFSVLSLNGQEIKLSSSVLASAGSNAEINTINISKWRLGEVHFIVLKNNDSAVLSAKDWTINSFPNPFTKILNLEYIAEKKSEYTIQVTDITGKKLWYNQAKTFIPNETMKLDLGFLVPSLYLVSISSKDNSILQVIKVLKQ